MPGVTRIIDTSMRLDHRFCHATFMHQSVRLRIAIIASCSLLLVYILVSSLSAPRHSAALNHDVDFLDGPSWYNSAIDQSSSSNSSSRSSSRLVDFKTKLSNLHSAVSSRLGWSTYYDAKEKSGNERLSSGPGIYTSYSVYNRTRPVSVSSSARIPNDTRDSLGEKRRIAKCTMIFTGSSNDKIYERALRTHEYHDRIHGYPLYVLRHNLLDDVWSKPGWILHLLLEQLSKPAPERLEWIFWVDADTILLNPNIPLETFLPPSPEFDYVNLLFTRDWNGLNNGVFPIRVTQWSVDLFAAIVSYRHYLPDADLTFRDQSAMDALLSRDLFAKHAIAVPQRWFNAYQGEVNETLNPFQARRGDFLVHFAGVGPRGERMAYWLDRLEGHLPDWELDVASTSYPAETREFWRQQGEIRRKEQKEREDVVLYAKKLLAEIPVEVKAHGAKVSEKERKRIQKQEARLKDLVSKPTELVDLQAVKHAVEALLKAKHPLDKSSTITTSALLKQAHEAIFSANQLLAQVTSSAPSTSQSGKYKSTKQVLILTSAVDALKKLILEGDDEKGAAGDKQAGEGDTDGDTDGKTDGETDGKTDGKGKDSSSAVKGDTKSATQLLERRIKDVQLAERKLRDVLDEQRRIDALKKAATATGAEANAYTATTRPATDPSSQSKTLLHSTDEVLTDDKKDPHGHSTSTTTATEDLKSAK